MMSGSITKLTMFPPMLAADPSFLSEWEEFLNEWGEDPNPPLYIALGSLALHLLDRVERGDVIGFDTVFSVVEQWHIDGDAYVREAATIGLLEGLQNRWHDRQSCRRTGDPPMPSIEPWLLPVSKEWWDRLIRFWDGEASALREPS
jgi:hypothetical protein